MTPRHELPVILMADDDEEDCMLTRDALREGHLLNPLYFVHDGQDLLHYLRHIGRYATEDAPYPSIVLLDLNMPRKDGREALREIKLDPNLRRIPVIILTTSSSEIDIYKSYDLGANAYIVKPVTFDALVKVMQGMAAFWFQIVEFSDAGKPAR
jgi:CheY-like chemotaxis protein